MKKKNRIVLVCLCVVVAGLGIFFCVGGEKKSEQKVRTYTAFIGVNGEGIDKENRIQQKITQKIGAKADTEWLKGQTASERVQNMISKGQYPDFIDASDATNELIAAGALVPLEDYIDDYPNLKNYFTKQQWESLRREDGHIYYIPEFSVVQGQSMGVTYSGEAFWIQKRVLEWANYPTVKTLDDYFTLISNYLKENPMTDGKPNIGFEILCDGWRNFCLENPPMFLAGYPNDGCAIVDPNTQKASVYDTIPEAKQYFKKLCEMFHEKVIDPETFTLSYNQYIEKLSSGSVLGMVDQYWEMMSAQSTLYAMGREDCTYVPLPLTMSEDIAPDYNRTDQQINTASGLGITTSCKDVEGAMQFLNDLLDPEIVTLRSWGEEGIDYEKDKNGCFYRTEEQRKNHNSDTYLKTNHCAYTYFPNYLGMLADGINAASPGEQPGEYYATLSAYDKKILDAYGHKTWAQFMGQEKKGEVWFPLYSSKDSWTEDTAYGKASLQMNEIKKEWLPKLIMSFENEFDKNWDNYMNAYQNLVDVKAYEEQLNKEIQKRIKAAT